MQSLSRETNENTSIWIGFIFIFNLIVGTGALILPSVFAKSGWLLSLIVVTFLAIISYMTVSFVIETIACANAVKNFQILEFRNESNEESNDEDDELLLGGRNNDAFESELEQRRLRNVYYRMDRKFELGEMAGLFFNDFGRIMFYLCLTLYLYGDLSIYATAVAKTLRDIVCNAQNSTSKIEASMGGALMMFNSSYDDGKSDDSMTCWKHYSTLTRLDVYRIFLVGFITTVGPFAFANSVQKTKYLQILTVIFRWAAFILMISIAVKLMISDGIKGHPVAINIYGVPPLFGACVYSFMCHHSLPSIIHPLRNKNKLHSLFSIDYITICIFYLLLAMTGIFAFDHLKDLYTLNFIPKTGDKFSLIIDYFLALFPVFTLTTSFPIIAITLRNNLQTLFLDMSRFESYNFVIRRIAFPLLAILPPFIITYFTQDLTSLVAFTGSYAGNAIQYIIPISLVFFARRMCKELLGNGVTNEYQSWFRNGFWLVVVLIWSILCICLVTLHLFG